MIEVADTDAATIFDGSCGHTVCIGGFVHVVGGANLELMGTIDLAAQGNNGTIDLDLIHLTHSPDIGAELSISGTVMLTGSGGVTMQGDADKIIAASPGAALHNAATIVGAGSIGVGDNDLTLVNELCGVINANNASADSLTIDTGCNTIVNHGILEATGGATLVLNSDVDNRCGIIQATGSNATVELNDITVSDGTLETSCGGLIQVGCGSDTTIECASIACGTDVQVDSGATLTLDNDTVTGTTFHDACSAILAVDGDTTSTLSGVTVHGGAIDGVDAATSGDVVASTIDVTGDSTFCGVHLSGGNLTVESDVTLTLSGDKVSDVAIAGTDASGSIVASTIDVTGDSERPVTSPTRSVPKRCRIWSRAPCTRGSDARCSIIRSRRSTASREINGLPSASVSRARIEVAVLVRIELEEARSGAEFLR